MESSKNDSQMEEITVTLILNRESPIEDKDETDFVTHEVNYTFLPQDYSQEELSIASTVEGRSVFVNWMKKEDAATDTAELNFERNEEISQLLQRLEELKDDQREKSEVVDRVRQARLGRPAQISEEDLQRHLQARKEVVELTNKLRDLQRDVEIIMEKNRQLSLENGRLFDELAEKERTSRQLTSEVDNLDKILGAMSAPGEERMIEKLQQELELSELKKSQTVQMLSAVDVQLKQIQAVSEEKSQTLHLKEREANMLKQQAKQLEKDLSSRKLQSIPVSNTITPPETLGALLQEQIAYEKEFKAINSSLSEEHDVLQQRALSMGNQLSELDIVRRETQELKKTLHNMTMDLQQKRRCEMEHQHLLRLCNATKFALEHQKDVLTWQRKVDYWKSRVDQLKTENSHFKQCKQNFSEELQTHKENADKREVLLHQLNVSLSQEERLCHEIKIKDKAIQHLAMQLEQKVPSHLLVSQSDAITSDTNLSLPKDGIPSRRTKPIKSPSIQSGLLKNL